MMKFRHYCLLLLIILFFIKGYGQYSGNYTIDYTASASTTNFTSLGSAFDSLENNGINGPVELRMVGHTAVIYDKVLIDSIPGASAVNQITLKGSNDTLRPYSGAYGYYILAFDKADHINVDSLIFDLRFVNTSLRKWAVVIMKDNRGLSFTNCQFLLDTLLGFNSYTHGAIIVSNDTVNSFLNKSSVDDLIINDNYFSHGKHHVYIDGDTADYSNGIEISNNTFEDAKFDMVRLVAVSDITCNGNSFSKPNWNTFGQSYFAPLNISFAEGGAEISRNKFYNVYGEMGNNGYPSSAFAVALYEYWDMTNPALIFNNLIYDFNYEGNNSNHLGIAITKCNNVGIYFNTFSFDHPIGQGVGADIIKIDQNVGTSQNIEIKNNLFSLSRIGGGNKSILNFYDSTATITSDNNVVFKRPGTLGYYSGRLGSQNFGTFKDWVTNTGYDINSDSTKPFFVDLENHDLTPRSVYANGIASPIAGITTDYFGNARNITNPDPGAIEFSVSNDLEIFNASERFDTLCPGEYDFHVKVLNHGPDPITHFEILFNYDGVFVDTFNISQNIAVGDTAVVFVDSIEVEGVHWIHAQVKNPNGITDKIYENDGTYDTLKIKLDGNYNLDHNIPTRGRNFQSLTDAVYSLNTRGICGEVNIDYIANTAHYYDNNVIIKKIDGTNDSTWVNINGNGQTMNTSNYTGIRFQKTDHIRLDSLKIIPGLRFWGGPIHIRGSSYIDVTNCIVNDAPVSASHYGGALIYIQELTSPDGGFSDHINIIGNTTRNGRYGIYAEGSADTLLTYINIEDNNVHNAAQTGIHYFSISNGNLKGNTITGDTSVYPTMNKYAIHSLALKNVNIDGNEINGLHNATTNLYGIRYWGDSIHINNRITNNIVHGLGDFVNGSLGIYVWNESATMLVAHNTIINRLDYSAINGYYSCMYLTSHDNVAFTVRNNLFQIRAPDHRATALNMSGVTMTNVIVDNNVFDVDTAGGQTWYGYYPTSPYFYNSFSAFQAVNGGTFNQNSFALPAQIIDYPENFRPHNLMIANQGINVGVTSDFYNTSRDTMQPDIGAVESPNTPVDIATSSLSALNYDSCESAVQTFRALASNTGRSDLFNVPFHLVFSDSNGLDTFSITVDTLFAGVLDTLSFDSVSTIGGGLISVHCFSDYPGDPIAINDTSYDSLNFYVRPVLDSMPDYYKCVDRTFTISLTPDPDSRYFWFLDSTTSIADRVGNLKPMPKIYQDTVFYIEKRELQADCESKRVPMLVKAIAIPEALDDVDSLVCFGVPFNYEASADTQYTYLWYSDPITKIPIDTGRVKPMQLTLDTTAYMEVMEPFDNCKSERSRIDLSVEHLNPAFNFQEWQVGLIKFSNATTGDQTGYLWSFGDGQTSIDSSPSHQYIENDTFLVQLLVNGYCGPDSVQQTVIISTLYQGIQRAESNTDFTIYPNPSSSGHFTIERSSGEFNFTELTIFSERGQLIRSESWRENQKYEIDLPVGVYFLQLRTSDHVLIYKLISR